MTAYDIIMKKRRGGELSENEIYWFVNGYVNDIIPDYQMSALLMAICFNSMTLEETTALTMAMMHSGDTLCPSDELGRVCIDKHSTGGVGDKTTLIIAPICAACGIYVPKMSGRGLGHTGGTIDKLEAIPGFNTSLKHDEFIDIIKKVGFAVAGQTSSLVPADKKIYALRNATATVDSLPLICSSIMSKKLATGADGIVLDVKCGDGAFMKNFDDAKALANAMVNVGKLADRKCTAIITDMDKPLGRAVGNSIEVIEAIDVLKGKSTADLYDISITLAAEMLMMAGLGDATRCCELAVDAIISGKALEALKTMIRLQGGNPDVTDNYSLLGTPAICKEVIAESSGYINTISCEKTGLISLNLGAGRKTKDDRIDPTAGVLFNYTVGDYVNKGDVLGTLMTSSDCDIEAASRDFINIFDIADNPVEVRPTIYEIIR